MTDASQTLAPAAATQSDTIKRKSALQRLLRDKPAVIAAIFLILVVLAAIFAPYLTPYDPYNTNMRVRLRPPGGDFLLGTDAQGRDMVTRLLFGIRTTLVIGLCGVLFGGLIGATLGILAAFYKKLDNIIMRVVDVLLSFPSILFGLAIAAVLGAGTFSLIVALSIAAVPTVARISRGAATVVMQNEYMEAGRAVGLSDWTLIWRYLTLNCLSAIFVYLTLQFGQTILLGAALSFLGLGAQPPTAELGTMAAEGRNFLFFAPHVSTIPSVAIFLIVLAFNVLGDALRDVLDPRLRQ
ncbi:ABC transporter permease [Oceanibaculum pacificum]|uniref:Glutathione ABC transporter permease n=1 Tax=Oceanibaculum pacificum TaxID=580166 RepID=A0A154WGI3_9PROT|nr:ABC transporter permease [Oceanibaculum pacificum]KZD12565.1 glutathione ABC transporter permease [Oceanibaculum pacificum]